MTMTNEEAKKELSKLIFELGFEDNVDDRVCALNMAIQALSQEPCDKCVYSTKDGCCQYDDITETIPPLESYDDAISREELLKAIDTWDKFGYTETGCFVRITKEIDNYVPYVHLEDVITAIQKLPPVTQKSGKWILQPSNKEQDERDFIWWKCSECGHIIYSETEKDRQEYHAFCGRCGVRME